MKILAIAGENLASLEPFEVRLDRGPLAHAGLFVICGPTGAGKSTLLDAMCLALYGQTPRLPKDIQPLLRQSAVFASAQVEFIGQDGNHWLAKWHIRRAHKKLAGDWQDPVLELSPLPTGKSEGSQRKTDTLRLIAQKVGLGFDEFCRAVLLAQGEFARFLRAPGKERAQLLELITGGELYSRLSMEAFEHDKAAKVVLAALQEGQKREAPLGKDERAQLEADLSQVEAEVTRLERAFSAYEQLLVYHQATGEHGKHAQEATEQLSQAQTLLADQAPLAQTLQQWEHAQPLRQQLSDVQRTTEVWHKQGKAALDCQQQLEQVYKKHQALAELHHFKHQQQQQLDKQMQFAQPLLQQLMQVGTDQTQLRPNHSDAGALLGKYLQQHTQMETSLHNKRDEQAQAEVRCDQAQVFLTQHPALQWATAHQQSLHVQLDALVVVQQQLVDKQAQLDLLTPKCEAEAQQVAQLLADEVPLSRVYDEAVQEQKLHNQQLLAHRKQRTDDSAQHEQQALTELFAGVAAYKQLLQRQQQLLQQQAALQGRMQQAEDEQQRESKQLERARTEEKQHASAVQALLRDVNIQKAAMELAARRPELLQSGKPCPLCGSCEHPHAGRLIPGSSALLMLQQHQAEAETAHNKAQEQVRKTQLNLREQKTRHDGSQKQATDVLTEQEEVQAQCDQEQDKLIKRLVGLNIVLVEPLLSETQPTDGQVHPTKLEVELTKQQDALTSWQVHLTKLEVELTKRQDALTSWQVHLKNLLNQQENGRIGLEQRQVQLNNVREQLQKEQEKSNQGRNNQLVLRTKKEESQSRFDVQLKELQVQLLDHQKWQDLLVHDPKELQKILADGVVQWTLQLNARNQAEEARRNLEHAVQLLMQAQVPLRDQLNQQQNVLAQLSKQVEALHQQEQMLWTELGQVAPQQSASSQLQDLAKQQAQATEEVTRAKQALDEVKLAQAGVDVAYRAAELQQHEAKQQQDEAQLQLGKAVLAAGFAEVVQVQKLLAVTDAQRSAEKAELNRLRTDLTKAQALLDDRLQRQVAHQQQDLRPLLQLVLHQVADELLPALLQVPPVSEVEDGKANVTGQLNKLRPSSYLHRLKLAEDDNRVSALPQKADLLKAQTELCAQWSQLSGLIGQADGARFRNFAQELTLEVLLLHANAHLAQLRPRYFLQQSKKPLELSIVDRHMGEQVRDCQTLSGGESFITVGAQRTSRFPVYRRGL
jgi:DNA repair protein SbcC/Rad50